MSGSNVSEEEIVIAVDINDNPHPKPLKNFEFRVSTYGLLKSGNKILVTRNPETAKYGLPGGAIELGEKISDALVREFKEETGFKVKVGELLDVSDSLFTFKEHDTHAIIIIYAVDKIGGNIISKGNGDDTVSVKYKDIDDLLDDNIESIFKKVISDAREKNI